MLLLLLLLEKVTTTAIHCRGRPLSLIQFSAISSRFMVFLFYL